MPSYRRSNKRGGGPPPSFCRCFFDGTGKKPAFPQTASGGANRRSPLSQPAQRRRKSDVRRRTLPPEAGEEAGGGDRCLVRTQYSTRQTQGRRFCAIQCEGKEDGRTSKVCQSFSRRSALTEQRCVLNRRERESFFRVCLREIMLCSSLLYVLLPRQSEHLE